jgi:hypothetical protein
MPTRPFITALLSILLLIGGPNQGLAGVASGKTDSTGINTIACDGTGHAQAYISRINQSGLPGGCDVSEQENCRLAAPHCASVPVLGIITGAPIPPIELAAQGHLIPPGEAYHNHTSDVLTPPPDTLS